jgi:hypothetical protein
MPVILFLGAAIAFAFYMAQSGVVFPERERAAKLPAKPLGPDFIKGDRIVIVGLPLSGKTYLAGKLTKDCPRILFFDPYHDYVEAAGATEISADELIENPKLLAASTFRYAVIPDEDDLAEQLYSVVKFARAAGDLVLVMDEVGDYKRNAQLTLEKLARNGRHNGLVPIYVSQVAMDIPRTVRRIASRVYSFRQEDIEDIEALRERYGDAFAQKVKNLPPHEFALWRLPGFGQNQMSSQSQPRVREAPPKAENS